MELIISEEETAKIKATMQDDGSLDLVLPNEMFDELTSESPAGVWSETPYVVSEPAEDGSVAVLFAPSENVKFVLAGIPPEMLERGMSIRMRRQSERRIN